MARLLPGARLRGRRLRQGRRTTSTRRDYGFDHFAHDTFHDHEGDPGGGGVPEAARDRTHGEAALPVRRQQLAARAVAEDGRRTTPPRSRSRPALIDTPETRACRARYCRRRDEGRRRPGLDLRRGRARTSARARCSCSAATTARSGRFGKWNLLRRRHPRAADRRLARRGEAGHAHRRDGELDRPPADALEAAGGRRRRDRRRPSTAARSWPCCAARRTGHRDRIFATHSGDGAMNVYPIRAVRTPAWKYIRNLHPEFAAHHAHRSRAGTRTTVGYFRSWERRRRRATRTRPRSFDAIASARPRSSTTWRADPHRAAQPGCRSGAGVAPRGDAGRSGRLDARPGGHAARLPSAGSARNASRATMTP